MRQNDYKKLQEFIEHSYQYIDINIEKAEEYLEGKSETFMENKGYNIESLVTKLENLSNAFSEVENKLNFLLK